MTIQAPLLPFDAPPAVRLSDTSGSAAEQNKPVARSLRETVLQWFIKQGPQGGTDEECQLALGLKCQTQTPRRVELCRLGLLVDSGERRMTTSGRKAVVWRVNVLNYPEGLQ